MNQLNRTSLMAAASMGAASLVQGAVLPLGMDGEALLLAEAAARPARKHIWDLAGTYHCSVVGTCLSTAELRKLLGKLGMAGPGDSDHDLHGRGVGLAARRDLAGKMLNKALDERHQVAIRRYGRARTAAELTALWREDVKSGDIPGGYWAALTHPASSYELAREAFGYVHMLSHLVGAANRADIRRLQRLEEENAALREKVERQQARIREVTLAAEAEARTLRRELADMALAEKPGATAEETSGLAAVIADLRRQLEAQARRYAAATARADRAEEQARAAREAGRQLSVAHARLQGEMDALERALHVGGGDEPAQALPGLDGRTVLYVGGRPTQVPHLRRAAQARGAALLHHDGGIEDSDAILAGLVSRADVVMFPVDCVSHAAAGTVKRACRHAGKTFLPLRSAAVTSFIAALGV